MLAALASSADRMRRAVDMEPTLTWEEMNNIKEQIATDVRILMNEEMEQQEWIDAINKWAHKIEVIKKTRAE